MLYISTGSMPKSLPFSAQEQEVTSDGLNFLILYEGDIQTHPSHSTKVSQTSYAAFLHCFTLLPYYAILWPPLPPLQYT